MLSGIENWAAGMAAITGSVLLQYGAQVLLVRLAQRHAHRLPPAGRDAPKLVLPILFAVLVLIFGHLFQVLVWAAAYAVLGELGTMADRLYFSLASYTSVGADDLELSRGHRILGALEAGVGTLMFGWSTALLVALLVRTGPTDGTG